jgi:hypothetical protein
MTKEDLVNSVATSPKDAADVINMIKYKPNWSITAKVNPNGDLRTTLTMYVQDANAVGGVMIDVHNHLIITKRQFPMNTCTLLSMLHNRIMSLEHHESKEWFIWGDTPIYDTNHG